MASVKWGIIGAGNISHDFCLALKTLPPNEHDIKAVAARSSERSRRFAEKFGIEKAYGTYDELIQDCDVDIVYIGTLNSSHKELSIKAILNDKHVLCEKPAAMNSKDLEDILATAKRTSSVVFMEAIWTRHFPLYHDMLRMIRDGDIGNVMTVQVSFGLSALESVDRVMKPELGGSVLMDIGMYAVNFADIAFMGEKPTKIAATGVFTEAGVDLSGSITFIYEGKRIAQMLYTGNANLPNEGIIVGTKGKIVVKSPFWCPTCIEVNDEKKEYPLPSTIKQTVFMNSAGLRFEAEHMRQLVLEKKNQSDVVSHEVSRRMLEFLDEIRTQMSM